MQASTLSDHEFGEFQRLIYRLAGINLSPAKKALVAGRLAKRLKHHGLGSYGEYFQLLSLHRDEVQVAVDLLTTNETYFFREPKHFDFLRDQILPRHPPGRPFRAMSTAGRFWPGRSNRPRRARDWCWAVRSSPWCRRHGRRSLAINWAGPSSCGFWLTR